MKTNLLSIAAALAVSQLFSPAQAATLEVTYTFSSNLNATQPGMPALTATDPLGQNSFQIDTVFGNSDTVYRFAGNASPTNQQAGLSLNTTGLVTPNNYSVEMIFSFDGNAGYRRIVDVQDRQTDAGFYVDPSNHLDVFPTSGTGPNTFALGYHHVVLTVASDGTVKGYIDGLGDLNTNTTVMNLTNSATNTMNFFLDNVVAGGQGEFSSGKVAQVELFDGVLTDAEALALSQVPTIAPEPSEWVLSIAGAASLLSFRRRRAAGV